MSNNFQIPDSVTRVTSTLAEAGFEAYLVGGCVRDLILHKTPKDWDVATNAHPEDIQSLFEETFYNNAFGTVGVVQKDEKVDSSTKVIEVTPYRKEGTYSDARRPDSVSFGVSLEEDLARRDLTINAIAYDPYKGHYHDPYKGHEDLAARTLRAVRDPRERFAEDALRMLRTIRLGAELGFGIEQQTYLALSEKAPLLARISKERIRDELVKIIMSPRPMEALLHMKQTGILHYVLPDLERSIGIEQNKAHSYPVFEHLLRALQHAADKNWPLEVRLSALLHDVSKPECRRKSPTGEWTFYGHEVVGSRVTRKILTDLKFPADVVDKVTSMVRWHMFFSDPEHITLSAVRRMINNVGPDNIWHLLDVRKCDRIGSGRPKEQPFRFRKYRSMVEEALRDPITVSMLRIDGKVVMEVTHETPGPKIGWILHALLEEVLDDPTKNTYEYLVERAKSLHILTVETLKQLGTKGVERKEVEEAKEVAALRKKNNVF